MYSPNEASKRLSPENIAEILVSENEVSEEQVQEALSRRREEGGSLGEILISDGYVSAEVLARVLSHHINMEYVVLSQEEVDADLIGTVGEETLVQCEAVPVRIEDGKLVVAMSDPADAEARSCVVESAGRPIIPVAAAEDAIRATRDRLLRNRDSEEASPQKTTAKKARTATGRKEPRTGGGPVLA